MSHLSTFILSIFVVKVTFILLAVYGLYVKGKNPKLAGTLDFWKKRVEFVFVTQMSVLLLYLFNPRATNTCTLNKEVKLLLFLFGFVLLLTENWSTFIHESVWFKHFQTILGRA